MKALGYVYRLLLSVWLGSMLFFAAAVTPVLFRTLTPTHAAQVVRALLPMLDAYSVCAGILLLGLALAAEGTPRGKERLRSGALALMAILAAVSLFVLTPKMAALRSQAGDQISMLATDHPTRREFGKLHGISSSLLLCELLLGLFALAIPLASRAEPHK